MSYDNLDDTLGQEYSTYGSIGESSQNSRRINENTSFDGDADADSIENESLLTPDATASTMQTTNDASPSTLPLMTKIGFGFGHIYNDLCAGVWFSYTLLFLHGVLNMPGTEAGSLMMVGQVADAIATPIIGSLTDKFGTKQRWHIFGTFLVFISFPLIFGICPMCDSVPSWRIFYFIIVIILFQIGWPIVQVSHLAIIPEMSRNQKDRSQLTAVRYSATVISNIIVFVVTWIILRANRKKTSDKIGPEDAYRFRDISLILTLIGVCMAACFHMSLTFGGYGQRRNQALAQRSTEQSYPRIHSTDGEQPETSTPRQHLLPRQRKNFLKSPHIYQYAFLYVFSRLFTTTSLIYIPLWLDERQMQAIPFSVNGGGRVSASVELIALVPMVSFVASFLASLLMNKSHRICGHQVAYFLGSMAAIGGCVLVETSVSSTLTNALLYGVAVIFGASSSITMISSLCLIADMIGKHAEQSGFVYSAVTFADKLITGIAVIIFESLKCSDRSFCPDYYKQVLARACGGAAILGVLTLFSLKITRRPRRSRSL